MIIFCFGVERFIFVEVLGVFCLFVIIVFDEISVWVGVFVIFCFGWEVLIGVWKEDVDDFFLFVVMLLILWVDLNDVVDIKEKDDWCLVKDLVDWLVLIFFVVFVCEFVMVFVVLMMVVSFFLVVWLFVIVFWCLVDSVLIVFMVEV